jgi:hypothetical protein
MTLLMMFATAGKGDVVDPPPGPPDGNGGYYFARPVQRREPAPVPQPAFAPGTRFRVRVLLEVGGATGSAQASGAAHLVGVRMDTGGARGKARAGGAMLTPGVLAQCAGAQVEIRMSMDEVAALLIAAR